MINKKDNKINPELYLIRFLFSPEMYGKYGNFIESKFLKDNSPELHRLLQTVVGWHQKYPNQEPSMEEFILYYGILFPPVSEKDAQVTNALFAKLGQIEVDEAVAKDFITHHVQRARATQTSLLALEVAEGRKDFDALVSDLKALEGISTPEADGSEFVELAEEGGFPEQGLRWRLPSMNRALGSLRKGDFGFLYARPEAGKTTFTLDEVMFMVDQLVKSDQGPCLWCNNEQPGQMVMMRAVCAYFGITMEKFFKNRAYAVKKFREQTGGKFLLYDKAYMTAKDVEKMCQKYKPSLIVFDQLDKVKGLTGREERDDLSLKRLYQWARELAKEYGPVIGICQAGQSGENKKWLTMDDVDGSKTAKQGEADWILGIGATHQAGLENIRHFHLSKNKLLGDSDTDPSLRHGKWDAVILPDICRFKDV